MSNIKITVEVEIRLWRTQGECQGTGITDVGCSTRTKMLIDKREWRNGANISLCCSVNYIDDDLSVGIHVKERGLANGQ